MSNLEGLLLPFKADEHSFNYEGWAYLPEDVIANRLDSICGIDGWGLETFEPQQVSLTHWVVRSTISIKIDGLWLSRTGIGEHAVSVPKSYSPDDMRYTLGIGENGAKGASTDAFRRSARLWGIGRYLLSLPKKNGKPLITNHDALARWLNQLDRAPDLKTVRSWASAGSQELEISELTSLGGSGKVDGIGRVSVKLSTNQQALIREMLNLPSYVSQQEVRLDYPFSIYVLHDGQEVIMSKPNRTLANKALGAQLVSKYLEAFGDISSLMQALGVKKLSDYKGAFTDADSHLARQLENINAELQT